MRRASWEVQSIEGSTRSREICLDGRVLQFAFSCPSRCLTVVKIERNTLIRVSAEMAWQH